MPRSRKVQLKLRRKPKDKDTCPFCTVLQEEIIREYTDFFILVNTYPYANWDMSPVKEHLMITPKKHLRSMQEFSEKEAKEYIKILTEYQSKGYSVYTRSFSSHMSSQPHLHTHLILLKTKRNNIEFVSQKPYINLFI